MRTVCAVMAMISVLGLRAQMPQSGPEKELNDLFSQAGSALSRHDYVTAIKTLQTALEKTRTDPKLKNKDLDALRGLGKAYSEAKQYDEAIQTYRTLLDRVKNECVPGVPGADRCADIRYDLGTAQMYKADYAGAVVTLQSAVALYTGVIKSNVSGDFRVAKENLRANAQSMLAAAEFRAGRRPESLAAFQKAIDEYAAVINNPSASEGLKMIARRGLTDAQTSLNMIKADAAAQKK